MNIVSLSYQSKRIPIKEPSRTLIKNGGYRHLRSIKFIQFNI